MLAVVFAAEANNETQLASSLASTRGFAPACACVASSAAEARARAALLGASPPHADVTLLRVEAEGDAGYHNACLRACLATLPPACAAHSYALALEADQLLSLTPGTALPDATHGGVPEAARAGVAAGLAAALSRRAEGYLLWTSVDYVQQAALPLLLRGDAAWSYDAAQRAWKGGVAEDVLHCSAFVLRVEDAARFTENHARFVSNVNSFAQRVAVDTDDGEALYYLAHSLKDAGEFSRALPVFERRVALGVRSNATQAERDHVFLAHMLSGRIHAVYGNIDEALGCYLRAAEALPSRRTEALTELATMLRLAGQQSRALPFAMAASQASLEDSPPPPGTLYVNEAPYDFYADLELSLAAYSAADTDTLVAGVQALTRLLAKAHISRRFWLASYDNAAAFIAKLEAREHGLTEIAREALAALHAARTPASHVCSHERVLLSGALFDAADDTACGPDSILGSRFSAVAVIELPSRAHHVARFLASLGCSHYIRVAAVTHLTPAELSRDHNPRLRNGEIRLVQAHACALECAASLPAGARPLAIFEDDVAPVKPASLPAVQHVTARLSAVFDGAGADMVLLGRCPCTAVSATLPADALVQPMQHGFAAVCAHAYAVTPTAATRLHAALSASASSLPAELDIFYLRMQERGELRVYTNAGASVYSQRQFAAALGVAQLKGPRCEAVELPPATAKPPLKLTSFGSWISNTVTLDEMWLISFVLQNVTGRTVEQIDTTRIAEADVIFVAAFAENRTLVEGMLAKYSAKAVIIFAVGENTHEPGYATYQDQLVPLADVSLGHRRDVKAPTYMRFPWWIPTALVRRSAASTLDAVGFHPALLQPADASAWVARPGFAVFVNAHEAHPRRELFGLVSSIGRVDAPGRALNTMPWPRDISNDIAGKSELLSRYRFTLCPENSMSHDRGYVTEKLPEAHVAGAVPLYWGDGAADDEVWNMRRVLLFDNRTSNAALLDTMLRLDRDVNFRRAWFEEPVLASGADAWLAAFMTQLAGHFSRALAAKGHRVLAQPSTLPRVLTTPAGHPVLSSMAAPAYGGLDATDATGAASLTYPREFSVCTLSKDEHRYIPEWLEFHLMQGVSHFTIYDHGSRPAYSTAGFEDVLEVIDAAALFPAECGVRHFEEHPHMRCAFAVFNHCVKRNVHLSKWVGIFDVDEFIFAQHPSTLAEFINARGADAYHFKGVVFGNGWHERPPADEPGLPVPLLTAHFTHRQPCDVPGELRHLVFANKEVFNPRKLVQATVHSHEYVAGVVPVQVDTCDAALETPGILFFHYQHRSAEESMLKSIKNNNTFLRLTDTVTALLNSISDKRATVYEPELLSRLVGKLQTVPNSGPAPSPPRVHLASFCGCAFETRRAAFIAEAHESGLFDSVSVAALGDLDAAFRQQHAAILAHERGCGYFIWKAKVALAVLTSSFVRSGDVLAYVDCGCTFNASARPVFDAWVAETLASPSGLLGMQMNHLQERDWTKADLLHFLGAKNDASVTHTGQLLGGIWFIRVQPSAVTSLQRWTQVMTAEAYRFLDDSPSILPNAPSFREHRHDQSVWSVLRKQAGAAMVADITYSNASSPIRAARCTSEVCDPPSHPLPIVYPYSNEEGLLGRDFFDSGVERQIQELVRLSVGSSTLFVDVGANTGFFSLLAASRGSSVLAFEPQPHCAELMRATLRSANARLAQRIDFRTAAVGDVAGGSIRVPSNTCWGGFDAGATEHHAPMDADVLLVSLASAVAPTPTQLSLFFKIDTEGAEVGVLKGVLELRERHPERAIRVVVELIPRLWAARGSSVEEGVDVLRRLQRWFAVTLLSDETGFGFQRLGVQLPDNVGGPAFDSFDVEALVHDRLHANAGCNLMLDYAPSAGLLSGKLLGGLGNQLFVMARVHSLALLTGRTAVLYDADATSSLHTPAGAYVDTVFARYARTATAPDLVVGEPAEFVATAAPALPASARHAHLDGYWQHESNIAPGFVGSLQLPLVPPRPHTAFVHVRRGDYVGHAVHDVGLVAAGYYAAAMQLLRDKARDPLLRLLVFSDDPDWCQRSGLFTGADVDFFDDGGDPVLSLMTMAACALGGVAANSSFSWWAAFLNSSPLKVILFPLRWLNGFHGPNDIWLNGSYVVHPDGQAQLIQRPPPPPSPSPPSSLRAPPAFDLMLYINLDSRGDKRAAVEAELAAVGWSGRRVTAVHKAPGELGCALSHIAALQLLLDHPSARHALVLEDDFMFVRDPRADVARFLDRFGADGWDVLMLSSNTRLEQPHGDVDFVTRILEAQTTSGYAVTRAFAPALLASFNRSAELLADVSLRHADGAVQTEHCIDQQWKRLQPLARWFCLAPRAGAQRPGLSDITGLVVDHGGV